MSNLTRFIATARLFLSDLHLGTRGCQAYLILDMLRHVEAETIYLVGDIIDGWRLRSGWYWPQAHNDVVQKLLRKVRRGARMVFVPGNHDEFARQFFGLTLRWHRDQAPGDPHRRRRQALSHHPWRRIRRRRPPLEVARLFRRLGLRRRPCSSTRISTRRAGRSACPIGRSRPGPNSRSRTRSISSARSRSELAGEAKRRGVDGVVCGHIHHPVIREIDGVTYVNTGDFVESCSLVVEHQDGRLEVLRWPTGR